MKIQESVAEKIAGAGESVTNLVIEKLASAEINRRVDVISQAIGRLETLKKEFKKTDKPDAVTYVDGKRMEATSEKRFQEIDKAKKAVDRLESAINTALEQNTEDAYKKLSEAMGGGHKQESKPEEKE